MSLSTLDRTPPAKFAHIPLIVMLVLWLGAIVAWLLTQDALLSLLLGYIGLIVGFGIGGYIALPDKQRPSARRWVMALVGSLLLALAVITDHGNMQIEGFFLALFAGVGPFIVLHYAIAKIIGPLLFGRIWCGWACWFGMVFDALPYPYSRYRRTGGWEKLRYVHFAVMLVAMAVLWYGFGYQAGAIGTSGMVWFVVSLAIYYALGIGLALALKDNRAFCKYLCPLAVPLKTFSRFSALKVTGTAERCGECEACIEMCPMNIRVKDYLLENRRVLSTECTLCQTCINICPQNSLKLSFGLDIGGVEHTDYEPPKPRSTPNGKHNV